MELYYVLIAVAILLSFSLGLRKFARFLYLSYKIPGPSLWQMATVHAKHLLGDDMVSYMCDLCAAYNFKPWSSWMSDGTFIIFVSDRETIGAVYKNKHTVEKADFLYRKMNNLLGNNLFTMRSGRDYAKHRKSMCSGLRRELQVLLLPKMCEPMSKFVRTVRQEAVGRKDVDVRSLVTVHMMASAFGYLFSTPPDNFSEMRQLWVQHIQSRLQQLLMEALNPIYYHFYLRWTPSSRHNVSAVRSLMAGVDEVILNERFSAFEKSDVGLYGSQNPVATIIQSFQKQICGSDKELCELIRIIPVATIDSTSFVANVLLLVLALHQDVQQRLFEEIRSVLGEAERPILLEDLDRMSYMETVIKETLRLYPPAPSMGREVSEETNLNGVLAPKGSAVLVNVLAVHRNPEYFPDPLKFDPDRFSPAASKDILPYTFIPFSAGTRNCPGEVYVYLMVKLFLCYAVGNFVVLPGDKLNSLDDIKVTMCLTLHLKKSSLRFVERIPGKQKC